MRMRRGLEEFARGLLSSGAGGSGRRGREQWAALRGGLGGHGLVYKRAHIPS